MSLSEPSKLFSDAHQGASSASLPYSVLICTRNRGILLVPTVRSILATEVSCDELIVVDQSLGNATACALAPFQMDARVRYFHVTTQGKGMALNLGLQLARNEIVAITDDDCEVAPDWPRQHLAAFARCPRVAMTYGNVLPVDHDFIKGFIPTYYVNADRLVTNIWQKLSARGIGANTAVRRAAILELGGFDLELCPGGKFKACVDPDMTIRCILSGLHVYELGKARSIIMAFAIGIRAVFSPAMPFTGLGPPTSSHCATAITPRLFCCYGNFWRMPCCLPFGRR